MYFVGLYLALWDNLQKSYGMKDFISYETPLTVVPVIFHYTLIVSSNQTQSPITQNSIFFQSSNDHYSNFGSIVFPISHHKMIPRKDRFSVCD